MLLSLMRFMIRPSFVRQMIQTLRYPSQVGNELPAAEVLSIVVSEYNRRKGIGRALMDRAFEEFRKREIKCVKVAVGAGNETANKFYLRCGFELAVTRRHHGLPMNVYVISL